MMSSRPVLTAHGRLEEENTLSPNTKGRKRMSPFLGTANPEQLAIMSEAFDGHCLQHGIVGETDRSDIARLVMLLFEGGAKSVEELKAGLDRQRKF